MKKNNLRIILFLTACICCILQTNAQEKIFANYFDIETNSPEGTEVIGKIHLERNKDVMTNPIPEGYSFEILKQEDNMFKIETTFDPSKRIMGVLSVNKGKNTGKRPGKKHLTIALKNGEKTINEFDIKINITKETLWSVFNRRYTPIATKNPRMYGSKKFTDKETAFYIQELKDNNWNFKNFRCYDSHPDEYKAYFNPKNDHAPSNTIEYDWVKVTELIGGLGYAYINSKVYGPEGSPAKRKELREALYNSIYTYMQSVPVEGSDLKIDGKDIGNCTGDGFILLQEHKMAGMQITTHQWTMTDALIAPILHLMPDLLKKMDKGDKFSLDFHNAMIRYFQVFFAEIKGRRPIDDPNGRWGELQDTIYSAGAWADANLGHRSRTMLALPIIWHDYNRPLTYVQYWYTDFYNNKPFKDFSYSTGWSPCGIVKDISYWMTKFNVVAHKYMQSGFQPDGTVSHHIGHGTDAAMVAYGFEWLTGCNTGYAYLKDTKFKIDSNHYQFQLDRLLKVYPNLFYKGHMDFLVSGRTFLTDLKSFVSGTYLRAIKSLEKSRSKDTELNGMEELKTIASQLKNNTFETTATKAFWVNEFLVHRKAESGKTFYSSVKLKSERTVGIEDFSKPRKSWHGGYGILQVKVKGDEYDKNVLSNMDWACPSGPDRGMAHRPIPCRRGCTSLTAGGKQGLRCHV